MQPPTVAARGNRTPPNRLILSTDTPVSLPRLRIPPTTEGYYVRDVWLGI